jgi:hypothetical protein
MREYAIRSLSVVDDGCPTLLRWALPQLPGHTAEKILTAMPADRRPAPGRESGSFVESARVESELASTERARETGPVAPTRQRA